MHIRNISFNLIFLFWCLCTLFVTSSYFVDKEVLSKWYALYVLALSGCLFFCITAKSINLKIDKITICILVFFGFLLIGSSFSLTYGMSTVFQCAGFLLLFLFFKFNLNRHQISANLSIVIACTLQAIYGILQFTGMLNSNSSFIVVGSFDNPAGFAACLSAGFAFCFALFGEKKQLNFIAIVTVLLIGISIVLSQSRAGMISIFVITVIFLYHKFKHKLSKKDKKWILFSVLVVSIMLATSLFVLKKDSATGRLLIWETTTNMIAEKPILGWGSDSFRSQYMLCQADYFKNHPDSRFELLADNVTRPFNEYLLLTAEHGIVGLILLLVLIFIIYKKRNTEYPFYQLSILSILIFACFSYPFHYPFVWLILAYSLAKLSNNSTKIYYRWHDKINLILRMGVISILFSCCYLLMKDIQFEYKWKEVARLSLLGKTKTVMPQYEELHTQWNGNPLFLYNYGAELNHAKQYDKSILILHECEKNYNDYDVQILLGDNYLNLKEWNQAETCYMNASHMCPNRFLPLGELMNIYDSIGRKDDAIKIASEIINKPVKIQSSTIHKIKFKARQRLKNIESDKQ